MKKMKVLVTLLLFISSLLCSCGFLKDDTLVSAWDELHNSNFSYVETRTFQDESDKTASLVIKGECTADPYIFTQEIVEGDAIWSECYIFQEDDAYKGLVMIDGVWQEAKVGQDDPIFDGYEERNDIKILAKEEKSLDGISYVIYKTEYKTMVGEEYGLEENIEAIVSQEYYINKDTGKIERINTDTSDLNRANNIAISMYSSGDTLEEATEKANEQASETTVEVNITYIDGNYVLEIPEVKNLN